MRLVGVRLPGEELVSIARLIGSSSVQPITDVDSFWADAAEWVAKAAESAAESLSLDEVRIVPPVPPSARVICVGLNYRAHAAEGDFEVPAYPTLFGRWTSSLTAGDAPAWVPVQEVGLDWEGEIAAYVGKPLCEASSVTARSSILGYSTFNDLTARRAQKLTAQWTLGKNADHSGPMGPLVTADEVGDLREGLRVRTRVNGETVQDGNSRDMVFELGDVLSLISHTFRLNPGDVIATGTPEGVGYARTPPWLLGPGDIVEVEVDRLGVLRTPIIERPER